MKPKKILFILPSLRAGGAERVMSFVAKQLNSKEFRVKLIVIGFKKDCVYDIGNLDTVFLNKTRFVSAIYSIIALIVKYKPKIVVSSITHINFFMGFLALLFRKTKFIAREASVMTSMGRFYDVSFLVNKKLINFAYKNLGAIICQSEDIQTDLHENFKIPKEKLIIINNPITEKHALKTRENKTSLLKFVTIGRLSKEKGHKRILEGLSKISEYQFHYTLYGDGPLKKELQNLVKHLNLSNKVTFVSYTSKVAQVLAENDIFIQGSYVEGFPNSVLESCLVGTPVIAFDAPGGTREIISNGVNGYIVNNEDEFYEKLLNIDEVLRLDPKKIKEQVGKKFNSEKIINRYQKLFN
ncbi:glycosyltransferase [Aestuariivivens marinum]|uniref:glycosyltransferase n=1 Tax=Aestuariivivens marinum TaxID=2913555 RepID=UPI001F574B75|nr:glycosyltransferase [Aestuariivivens marinum]